MSSVSHLEFERFKMWVYKHLKPEADLMQLEGYLLEIKNGYSDMHDYELKRLAQCPSENNPAWEYVNLAINWGSLKEAKEIEVIRSGIAEVRTEIRALDYNIDQLKEQRVIKNNEAKLLGKQVSDVRVFSIRVDNEARKLQDVKLQIIPIDKIVEPANPMRMKTEIEFEDFDKSIKSDGIIQPISVFPKDDKFEIIFGHRRYLAAKQAGQTEILCLVRDKLTDRDIRKMRLTENIHRKDLNPMELYEDILLFKRDYPDITNEEMLMMINKPRSWLSKAGQVYNDPEFCHSVKTKAMPLGTAYEIVQSKKELPPMMVKGITEKVKNADLSEKQTREVISRAKYEMKRVSRGKYCYVCGERMQFKLGGADKFYPLNAHSHLVHDDHCDAAKCYHSKRSSGFQSSNDDIRTLNDDFR